MVRRHILVLSYVERKDGSAILRLRLRLHFRFRAAIVRLRYKRTGDCVPDSPEQLRQIRFQSPAVLAELKNLLLQWNWKAAIDGIPIAEFCRQGTPSAAVFGHVLQRLKKG